MDGTTVTLAEGIAVLRQEVVRAQRVVIISADEVRTPRSVTFSGPIVREVFGIGKGVPESETHRQGATESDPGRTSPVANGTTMRGGQ